MATYRQISGSGYGSAYIDALVAGGAVWDTSTGPLTFSFGLYHDRPGSITRHGGIGPKIGQDGLAYLLEDGWGPDTWDSATWDDAKATPVVNALAQAALVAQINIDVDLNLSRAYRPASDANLVVWSTNLENWDGGAVWSSADTPQDSFNANRSQSWLYLNTFDDGAWEVPHPGGMGFTMVLNMIGSALGLAQAYHAFPGVTSPYDPGPNGFNQAPFTVMSANWGYQGSAHPAGEWGSMKSFGAFDIAALQKIYGANTTTATGSNVYELPTWNGWNGEWGVGRATGWTCIWDAGGVDTISAKSAFESVKIDLRAATLADGDPNAGGFLSQQIGVAGGFTIANGAVIENAIGGSGKDTLIGNSANNKLSGGTGKDFFVFNATPNKKTNKDTITDFKVKDDTIWLDNAIFKKLGSKGSEKSPAKLKASFFKVSDKAQDRDDYIIYDKKKGVLSYDADGSGSKYNAIEFALLKKNLPLKYDDFAVI